MIMYVSLTREPRLVKVPSVKSDIGPDLEVISESKRATFIEILKKQLRKSN